ncbi:MAG: hypothetical protein Q8Q01_04120 [archaeon]|nr:hypothetical protein [archaeon]
MGRLRDAVRIPIDRKYEPRTIDELFIDQRSEIVGSDYSGNYRAASWEQDYPRMVKFSVSYEQIKDGKNIGVNLIEDSAEIYIPFRDEVAEVLGSIAMTFKSFIQGEVIMDEETERINFLVAITPVQVHRKDYIYQPAGVTRSLALTHLYKDR